jgi:inner membrane protein
VSRPGAGRGLAALGGIGALDAVRVARKWSVPMVAALDWPAHLITAGLLLAALPRRPEARVAGWALVGSVAIDLDHVPLYLGLEVAATEGSRPVTHSLTTAAAVLVAAVPARGRARTALVGLGTGVLLHLVRDLGTGPGVPLLWPLRPADVHLPYAAHTGLLALATAIPVLRGRQRGRRGVPR